MALLTKLLLAMLAGAAAHRGRPTLEHTLGRGWLELACYAAGVLLAWPFVLLLADDLKEIGDTGRRISAAYLLTFLAVGGGVGGAWFVDGLHADHPPIRSPDV